MMRFFALLIIIIIATFLYVSATQSKNTESDLTELGEEYTANWLINFNETVAMAKVEDKPILINFTGSNWCSACIRLNKEVFSKSAFVDFADENLILMEVDFPLGVQQEESLIDQNYKLMDEYFVNIFPTVILINYEGKILGKTGYRRGGPKAYVDHLKSLLGQED